MDNISFKSYIKYGKQQEFLNATGNIDKKYFVKYPWTIKESVSGRSAYTKDVEDCTVLGITDGIKVLLLHLCPTINLNWNKNKIKTMIKNGFDLSNGYTQGFLLGSKPDSNASPFSGNFFDYVKSVLDELKIPYSSFRGGNYIHDVAYIGDEDTWLISNELADNGVFNKMPPESKSKFAFDEVNLSKEDSYI